MRVIDSDTIVVRARIWLGQNIDTQVRLEGVDAPEIKGKCEHERRLALRARDLILTRSADGMVILSEIHYGKYAGRREFFKGPCRGWAGTGVQRGPPGVLV